MDKIENADKEQNIPNTLDGFNLPGENDQIVASQNVIDETNRLYIYLLSGQMTSVGLRFPFEDREYLVVPRNASSLQSLANQFALSPQRKWVHEQAENVDLESLNFITFQQLMHGLLQVIITS